jgi:Carbohydrate-binding module family 5/12
MAVIYRTSGPWGAGKGANLVAAEVDGNFYDVDQRVVALEDNLPDAANGIAYFAVSGNLFSVHMTNGTIQGPFALPQTAWNFRAEWLPTTTYNADDVVTANGSVYLVLVNHVSASSFDAGANDGAGHDYYGRLLTNPANVLPAGGDIGQYLTKTDDVDYALGWETPVVFPSQKLLEAPNATYSLTLANIASYVRCINASGCTITIPNDATINFPLSAEISFRQCTSGGIVLTAGSGVVLNTISGLSASTGRTGAVITAKKISANTWDVFGLLTT